MKTRAGSHEIASRNKLWQRTTVVQARCELTIRADRQRDGLKFWQAYRTCSPEPLEVIRDGDPGRAARFRGMPPRQRESLASEDLAAGSARRPTFRFASTGVIRARDQAAPAPASACSSRESHGT